MTLVNIIHNSVVHPLMPLAEILAKHGWMKPAIAIWKRHELTRSELAGFEKYHSDGHACIDGKKSNALHNCFWHPLLPIAELFNAISVAIWKGHESNLEDLEEFEKWYAFNEKKQAS